MTAQLALPGLGPDALTVAREELARATAAWEAAQATWRETGDGAGVHAAQPAYFRALILVDRLESGPKWWH